MLLSFDVERIVLLGVTMDNIASRLSNIIITKIVPVVCSAFHVEINGIPVTAFASYQQRWTGRSF